MNISSNKTVSNSSNYCFGLVVTIICIIVFFEVVPVKSILSISLKPEEEHMLAVPGLGVYSLFLIQKQDEDEKQCCQRRRIMFVDDELDITFTFKMILEGDMFEKVKAEKSHYHHRYVCCIGSRSKNYSSSIEVRRWQDN